MKSAPLSRRDRLRHLLADLRMPGALEALDAILQGVDGGTLTAPEAIEQLLTAQTQLFCKKAYVHEVSSLCGATTLAYRVAWV